MDRSFKGELSAVAGRMDGAVGDGLVNVEVTVADLEVEAAIGVGTHPGFVVNGRTLATKVRQGHEIPGLALLTLGQAGNFHESLPPPEPDAKTGRTSQIAGSIAELT